MWTAQGAGPLLHGSTEILPNGEVSGAIQAVAAHPTNANILYIGAVNGGIWKSTNATASPPAWTSQTDFAASLSIGAIDFDPTDATHNTLVAGIGRFSSFSGDGGARLGILRTTNGGTTWTLLNGGGVLTGKNISGVAARGNTIVVSVDDSDTGQRSGFGIFRSANAGTTFAQVLLGIPAGIARRVAGDPSNPAVLYTSIYNAANNGTNGIYKSFDTGATWVKVSNAAMDALLNNANGNNVQLSVHPAGQVIYCGIVNGGALAGIFRSANAGGTWTQMDSPTTIEQGQVQNLIPGGQGDTHFSLVADPTNPNIVYAGGDSQQNPFPTSIGATDFTGRLFRGDASQPTGSQWVHLTHSNSKGAAGGGTAGSSAPHADSRNMVFDRSGNIIEVDDGGVFRRTNPQTNTGDWFSICGNMAVGEYHNIAYDSIFNVVVAGTQDNASGRQTGRNLIPWETLTGGDGGAVQVDTTSAPGLSIVYYSSQNLQGFSRDTYNSATNAVTNASPALTVSGGGAALRGQFVTPFRLNAVNPAQIVFAAANSVYESSDRGNTITESGVGIGNGNAVAYGGYLGSAPNPDLLYVATPTGVFVRTNASGAIAATAAAFPGNSALDVAIVPTNWMTVFVVDDTNVYMSTNAGAAWTIITGNLTGVGSLRAVKHGPTNANSRIVVGTDTGVYVSSAPTLGTWSKVGTNLPTAPVMDMEYNQSADVLVIGTLGRGAWLVSNAASKIFNTTNAAPPPPPTILAQPQSTNVNVGATVAFGVIAGGTGPFTYQWQSNNVAIIGATASTFTLFNVQTNYSANYNVIVSNAGGSVTSSNAVLIVTVAGGGSGGGTNSLAPLAHWHFDEVAGPTAFDSVGNNHGTLSPTGSAFVPGGLSGNAISLTKAANGFVNMGNVLHLTNTDYTIVAWVKLPAGDRTDSRIVLSKQDGGLPFNPGYFVNVNTTGGLLQPDKASFYDGGTVVISATQSVVSVSSVNDGNWHQIVGVHKVGGSKVIYVDGSPAEASNPAQPTVANAQPFLIGGYNFSGIATGLWDGLIDEVQIYGRALSDPEIDYLYQNPSQEAQNIGSGIGGRHSLGPAPPFVWVQPAGGPAVSGSTNNGFAKGVKTDTFGNVYVTGNFPGTATFGTTNVTAAGNLDMFLAKYDANGTNLWVVRAGASGNVADGLDVALDTIGNVYVSGQFTGTARFGNSTNVTSNGQFDFFLAKYTTAGVFQWVRTGSGPTDDRAFGVIADSAGNVYVTGQFSGASQFGSFSVTSAGSVDMFLAKYDPNGNVLWVRSAGGAGVDQGFRLAMDLLGNVYVVGQFNGSATFGTTNLVSAGSDDIFVAKYDPNGSLVWVTSAGGSGSDIGYSIGLDAPGNIYITGQFAGTASFGTNALTSQGGLDVFIAKLNNAGQFLWAQSAGSSGDDNDFKAGIVVDPLGNSFITGSFATNAYFGTNLLAGYGSNDVFVASYDPNGNLIWAENAGGTGYDYARSIALAPDRSLLVCGTFANTASFTSLSVTSAGPGDVFVAKLASTNNSAVVNLLAPRAHWRFDETNGTTAFDSIDGNNGTLSTNGATFVPGGGISGGAIQLVRTNNGYVDMGPIFPFTAGNFSLIAWVKMNPGDTAPSVAIDKSLSGINNGYYLGENVNGPTGLTNKAHFFAGGVFTAPVSTTTVNDGNWHQLVATYQQTGLTRIYVDGVPAQGSSSSSPILPSPAADFLVGGATFSGLPTGYFGGLIDEVQVYDRALSDTEINFLFQNPNQEIQNPNTNVIASPPVIIVPPLSRTSNAGGPVTFSVSAAGTAPLFYQWQFNGVNIPGATTNTYTLNSAQSSDAGAYGVIVYNLAGSVVSAPVTLTIINPPVVTSSPLSQNAPVGSTVTFSVAATGTAPFGYIWRKNGLNLPAAIGSTATLTLVNVAAADAGSYDVVVFNTAGAALSAPATLTLFGTPVINGQPQSQTVTPGSTATFSVTASGAAPLSYQWRKNGVDLPGQNSATLTLNNVAPSDAAGYTVLVSNGAGSVLSQSATLALIGAPAIASQPQSLVLPAGTNATFTAAASGSDPLGYQWFFNSAPLPGATGPTLVLTNIGIPNEGAYYLFVSNSIGSATSAVATLNITLPPVILQQPQSVAVPVGGTATFNVSATGTAPPLTYQWKFNGTNIAGATTSTFIISNVSPANIGTYYVVVADGRGTNTSIYAQLSRGTGSSQVILFDGTTTTNFHHTSGLFPILWPIVPTNALQVTPGTGDIQTFQTFNDFQLHLEFRTPNPNDVQSGNSGVFLQGLYEVQILNSFGATNLTANDCGAIFGQTAPTTNACIAPGAWQTMDITFHAAQWNGNVKVVNAFVTVVLNGVTVQNNVAIVSPTTGGLENPVPGPIMLQDHNSAVQFRNIVITPLNTPPVFQWVRRAGSTNVTGNNFDFGKGVKVDTAGNVYVTGNFCGSADFGSTNVVSNGIQDFFLAKYDPAGTLLWVFTGGGAGFDEGLDLDLDPAGNPVVTGIFSGPATFGSTTLPGFGGQDVFIAKFTSSGQLSWIRSAGGFGLDNGTGVTVDFAGNVFVTGDFNQTANFGTTTLISVSGQAVFVAKYDSAGALQWVKQAGGLGADSGKDVASDNAGGVYVAGDIASQAFVSHYDTSGNVLWTVQSTGAGVVDATGLARDNLGNLFISGSFTGSSIMGTNTLVSAGAGDIFIAKMDTNGSFLWARQAGGLGNDNSFSGGRVAVDAVGNAYTSGGIGGDATFSSTLLTSFGGNDVFATKYDPAGNLVWVQQAGGSGFDYSRAIALDAVGNAYLVGSFHNTATFSSLTITSVGSGDIFVAKLGNAFAASQPPVIISQPQSTSVAVGATVTFSVSATGTQPLAYQWIKNGAPIPGATINSFTVANVQLTDAGAYTVTVTNSVGAAVSVPAFLNVIGPPVILTQPVASQTVSPGSTVVLTVSATGSEPLGYIWRLNGTNLPAPSLPTLTLNNVQPVNAGTYDVVVFNSAGVIVSSGSVLNVLPPPVISAQPLAQVVPQGSNAMFSVTANGTGSLTYQWRKNGTNISGANRSLFVVTGAQITDQGLYDVVVSDSIGSVISAPAPLTVLLPPLIIQPPQGVTVVAGTNVLFSVLASGNPPPFFQWLRNGIAITGATNSTLLLTNVTTNVAGLYLVSVTNAAGAAPVLPVPLIVVTSQFVPPPSPPPPNDLRTNGFTLNIAVAPNRIYRVQASTNLLNWVDIGYIAGNGPAVQQFLDNAATNMTRRFYRVVTP